MLREIHLKNKGSYNALGTTFKNLKEKNIIYGMNATGKSTFSKTMKNIEICQSEGTLILEGGDTGKVFVYNQDFIEENFLGDEKDEGIPGVFTLGKENIQNQKELKEIARQINKNEDDKASANKNKEEAKEDVEERQVSFRESLWESKRALGELGDFAFTGYNASKDKFKKEVLKRISNYANKEALELEDLQEKYDFMKEHFKSESKSEFLTSIKLLKDEVRVDYEIFEKPIINKENPILIELIKKLGHSRWLEEGHHLIKKHDLKECPLCQSTLKSSSISQLEEYFGEKYMKDKKYFEENMMILKNQEEDLRRKIKELINQSDFLELDLKSVLDIEEDLEGKIKENEELLRKKEKYMEKSVEVESLSKFYKKLNEEVKTINKKIKIYNDRLRNKEKEIEDLKNEIWNYFLNTYKNSIEEYIQYKKATLKRIQGLQETIEQHEKHISENKAREQELMTSKSNIVEVADNINRTLNKFGFKNFKLEPLEKKYKIVREDGSNAHHTLSEGEKTFVTFLYYYYLVQANNDRKTLVIDDPISSLDSSVLHITASLIRGLIDKYKSNNIQQTFLLTHNIYFYKEIVYEIKEASFYILRKDDKKGSYVTYYETSPIVNSYEALWKELVVLKDSDSILIQNVMRRILEHYFKFIGKVPKHKILEQFEEGTPDYYIVDSFFKWINDGSHHLPDSLFVQNSEADNTNYYEVFWKIFEVTKQESHYNMMVQSVTKDGEYDGPLKLIKAG